jgi:hypothetical protein
MASFADDQAPLKPNHAPQEDWISMMQMWAGCTVLSSGGSCHWKQDLLHEHEHEHPNHPSEATLASVVPSLVMPSPAMVSTSKAKLVIPSVSLSASATLH